MRTPDAGIVASWNFFLSGPENSHNQAGCNLVAESKCHRGQWDLLLSKYNVGGLVIYSLDKGERLAEEGDQQQNARLGKVGPGHPPLRPHEAVRIRLSLVPL